MPAVTRGLKPDFKPLFNKEKVEKAYISTTEEFKVHKVVAVRTRKGVEEVLIAWTLYPGYYTWEPKSQVEDSVHLLIADKQKPKPDLIKPSPDLVFQNMSTLAYSLQHSMAPENSPTIHVAFAENVFRETFGHLPRDAAGWSIVDRGDLISHFPLLFVHRYRKNPGEGRQPDFPIRMKSVVKKAGDYYAEFLVVSYEKDNRPLAAVEEEDYLRNHDEEEM